MGDAPQQRPAWEDLADDVFTVILTPVKLCATAD
jgi:hypothetical protein